jgi:GNAT superfamily N-acetyltransferase
MGKLRIDTLDTSSPALVDACVTLIVNAFGDPERYNPKRVARELIGDDPVFYRRFFVAMQAGEVLAVGGVKAADWATGTHLLYLSAVAPEKRGKGIGRALIQARIEWIEQTFPSGRILVSTARGRRFRDLGFSEIRHSAVDGRRLLIRRF